MTCLPGLIDLHVHLGGPANSVERSSADKALTILRNAQTMLRHGFTTVRGMGEEDAYFAPVAVRNAIARGDFEGPRMLVAPHMMSTTGGHGDFSALAPDLAVQVPSRVLTGGQQLLGWDGRATAVGIHRREAWREFNEHRLEQRLHRAQRMIGGNPRVDAT